MPSGRAHTSRRTVTALLSSRRSWHVLAALMLATVALGALSFQAVRREAIVRKRFVVDTHARLADLVSVRLRDALVDADRAIGTAISADDRRADSLISTLDAIEREEPWLQPLVLVVSEGDGTSASEDADVTAQTSLGVAFDALFSSAEREELIRKDLVVASALYTKAATASASPRRQLKALNGLARTLLRAGQPARARTVYDRMIGSADPLDPEQARWILVASDQRQRCDEAIDERSARAEHALAAFRFATGLRYVVDRDTAAFYAERARAVVGQSALSPRQDETWRRLQERVTRLASLDAVLRGSPDLALQPAGRFTLRSVAPKSAIGRQPVITYLLRDENVQALLAALIAEPGPWSEVGVAVIDAGGQPIASSLHPIPAERAPAASSLRGTPNWQVIAFPKSGSLDELAAGDVNRYAIWLVLVFGTVVAALVLAARSVSRELTLSRLRSEFVASVSHELKTPLSLIRMFAESLREGWVAEPQKQDYYEVITRESERLTGLINNVLDFSRIESGTRRYQFEVIDLRRLVVDLLERYEFHLRAANVELAREIPAEPVHAKVDRDAIEQVIVNLLSNAVKYMGDPTRQPRQVRVSLEREDRHVVLRVADTGIGISDEDRLHIFERFYRADDEQVRAVAGSGLGLTLVKAHVEAHAGTIAVDSAPGQGSSFVISLPLTAEGAKS